MSGSNPFRRSILSNAIPLNQNLGQVETVGTADRFPPPAPALGQENLRPTSGTKTVRIASPPATSRNERDIPDTGYLDPASIRKHESKRRSPIHHSVSSTSVLKEDELVNPFEAEVQEEDEDSEDPEMLDNTRQNSSVLPSSHRIAPRRPLEFGAKSPVESEQPSNSGSADADKRTGRPTPISRVGPVAARASLDVDRFKRLIMTGEKGITASGTPPTPPAQNATPQSILGDSCSNTDTSSISRHSLFESMTEAASDTPRTSHEISVSDDEWQQLPGGSSLATRKTDLQPSSVRYGTSVDRNMPRTVLFGDSSPHTIDIQASKTNLQSQVPTDLNKPLPLTPSFRQPGPSSSIQQDYSGAREPPNQLPSTSPSSISSKKRPPTPPLARRHSQLRSSNPLLPRSNSARLRPRSTHGIGSPTQVVDIRTPPLPPTRRTLPVRAQSSFDTSMHTGMVPPASPSTAGGSPRLERQHTSRPPLPPTRTHSISSIKRPYRPPPAASSVAKIPPAPPPRNRGSSQSSFDSTRIDMSPKPGATESGSSLRRASKDRQGEEFGAPVVSVPNANDILADLSMLQKEVDELRGMYEIRRASE